MARLDSSAVHPLSKPSARDIAGRIRLMIARREIHPGDRLRELELTERFAVSRGRIREALSSLEAAGVVKIEPRRGATVTRFSDAEVIDGYEIAIDLLGIAARRAAERGSAEEKKIIRDLASTLAGEASAMQVDDYLVAVSRIIRRMAQAAHNHHLLRLVDSVVLTGPPAVFGRQGVSSVARRREAGRAWLRLAQAISDGDTKEASAIVRKIHVQSLKAISASLAD